MRTYTAEERLLSVVRERIKAKRRRRGLKDKRLNINYSPVETDSASEEVSFLIYNQKVSNGRYLFP